MWLLRILSMQVLSEAPERASVSQASQQVFSLFLSLRHVHVDVLGCGVGPVLVVAGLEVVTDVAVLAAFAVEATSITTSDKSEAIVCDCLNLYSS